MAPSYEGQLVPLANHIVQLRRRPEFTAINQIADRVLQPAWSNSLLEEEVVAPDDPILDLADRRPALA